MNIIIPAAGIGKRFSDDGYDKPKPLVNVLGEPLIFHVIKNLNVGPDDKIYIIYNQHLDAFNFKYVLSKEFHALNINFITLGYNTRGAAETVLCGLNKIDDLDDKVLILDCDTFYLDDVVTAAKNTYGNIIFYFKDTSYSNIFSFINIDDNGFVDDIMEKTRISDNACTGAYGFISGHVLKTYCELVLNIENKSNGEYYISNLYDQMLDDDLVVSSYEVLNFHCLGTPQQLKSYCLSKEVNNKKRICFDLDNTLVTYPVIHNDYSTVKPIVSNIKLLKYLHSLGHTIIIHTARKMKSSGNNLGIAIKNAHQQVFATLTEYEIPYDEIYFGKPQADFYIDDLAVRPFLNIEKELGFYNGKIEPRHFNNIEYGNDCVIKTTNNPGEVYYYKNIPESISMYFPKVEILDENIIKLERINGIVFSYLLVNNSLTKYNIDVLLEAMKIMHAIRPVYSGIDTNDNYSKKILDRYKSFDYSVISNEADHYFEKIILHKYMDPQVGVIHGDLVFSNIFLCDNQVLKFIDMRGRVGDKETIYGDIFYDYAKVYQSLIGYDFVLNDYDINDMYIQELRCYFEECFVSMFSAEYLVHLKYITAGMLLSLIPLHIDVNKQRKYFDLIKKLI